MNEEKLGRTAHRSRRPGNDSVAEPAREQEGKQRENREKHKVPGQRRNGVLDAQHPGGVTVLGMGGRDGVPAVPGRETAEAARAVGIGLEPPC